MSRHQIQQLERDFGIVLPGCRGFLDEPEAQARIRAFDAGGTLFPAQQPLVTSPNAGIPAFLLTFQDPELTRVLVAPTVAAEFYGEAKKGDWEDGSIMFPMVESTGQASAYGDENENGVVGSNPNFEFRQPFMYQTITTYGDLQEARAGKAKIDWAAEQNLASAQVMRLYENDIYFYGVDGLLNYGGLNDPGLSTPIAPAGAWTYSTAPETIFADLQKLFAQLQAQSGGLITAKDAMKIGMSPTKSVFLSNANVYGKTVWDMLKQAYPNTEVVTAVQFTTDAGDLVQWIAESVQGQRTGYCSFTEKYRAHRVVEGLSSIKQKKSGGATGTIFRQLFAVAQMIGV